MGDDPTTRQLTVKVAEVDKDRLVEAIQPLALRLEDVRIT